MGTTKKIEASIEPEIKPKSTFRKILESLQEERRLELANWKPQPYMGCIYVGSDRYLKEKLNGVITPHKIYGETAIFGKQINPHLSLDYDLAVNFSDLRRPTE